MAVKLILVVCVTFISLCCVQAQHPADLQEEEGHCRKLNDVEECSKSNLQDLDSNEVERILKNKRSIDLLLIGKTGSGKSATGNTILGRKVFKTSTSSSSVTKNVQSDYTEYKGVEFKVVDGPGVGDTDLTQVEADEQIAAAMKYAMADSPNGYHAFLLVVRFGGRLTKEDQHTVTALKALFGEDFVRSWCILLVTHIDTFDPEETGLESIEEWYLNQEGTLGELIEECEGRVVMFDNKDRKKRNQQLDALIETIDQLSHRNQRYSDNNFKRAREERDRLIQESETRYLKEENRKEAVMIVQELSNLHKYDLQTRLNSLKILKFRTAMQLEDISLQDNNTDPAENETNVQENLFINILVIGDTRNDVIQTLNHKHNRVYVNVIEAFDAGREELNNKESLDLFIDLMMAASVCEGSHTILLVATPGETFHGQLLVQIKHLKALLGEGFIEKWCILIVPNFNQQEDSRTEEIIVEQNNRLRDLITECSKRVVSIDVNTKDKEMIQTQIDRLIQMVLIHQIEISGRRFFKEFLKKAVLERCKLDMADIVDQLEGIDSGDFETDLDDLKKLQQDSTRLLSEILKHDNETGVFRDVITDVRTLKMQIYEQLNGIQDEFLIYLEEDLAEERRITLEDRKQMLDEREELNQRRSTDKSIVGGALSVVGTVVRAVYSVAKNVLGYFFGF